MLYIPAGALTSSTNEIRLTEYGCHGAPPLGGGAFRSGSVMEGGDGLSKVFSREQPGLVALYEAGNVAVSDPMKFHVLPRSFAAPESLTPRETRLAARERG
jgi:hypothetical protein